MAHLQQPAGTTEEITSLQQGADLLCVSLPYFTSLLDDGKIPFCKVGAERKVNTADVLAYIQEYQQDASQAMRELVEEFQALELYK